MANGTSEDDPIAVIGEAHAGSAALTRVLLEIDDTQPDGAPSVTVWFLDAGEVKPPDNTAYPFGGQRSGLASVRKAPSRSWVYCCAALQKVSDADPSKLTYPATRVFMKVYAGLNAPWSRAMKILATGPDLASGSEAAAVVLAVFAGTPGYKHDDRVHEAMQVPFESQRFGDLLPTRLHPYSERYYAEKHVKFALFTDA